MQKICRFCLLAVAMIIYLGGLSQQHKVSGLMFTSSSPEALTSFKEGLKYFDLGENRKAREFFQKAVMQNPSFAMGYAYLADISSSPAEFAEYMEKAKKNLSGTSEWENLYYEYLATYPKSDVQKRLEIAQKMVASFPEVARTYVLLGEAYYDYADFKNSRTSFQKAIAVEPTWPTGYIVLINSLMFTEPKDQKMAQELAMELVNMEPSCNTYILLGDTYRAQDALKEAYETYTKAILLDEQSPVAYSKRGHALTFLGEFEKARADYQKSSTLDRTPTFSIQAIAFTWLYQNQPEKAMDFLITEAGKQVKTGVNATTHRFILLNRAADIAFHTNNSKKLASIIHALEPLSIEIGKTLGTRESVLNQKANMLIWKGQLAALNNKTAEARKKAEEIQKTLEEIQNPKKLQGQEFLLGFISIKEKKFEEAVEHFQKTNMENVYNKYWLARAYEKTGQKSTAEQLYREISKYNFNNIDYALIRNEVQKKI